MDINSARDCWSFARSTVMKILNKPTNDSGRRHRFLEKLILVPDQN